MRWGAVFMGSLCRLRAGIQNGDFPALSVKRPQCGQCRRLLSDNVGSREGAVLEGALATVAPTEQPLWSNPKNLGNDLHGRTADWLPLVVGGAQPTNSP